MAKTEYPKQLMSIQELHNIGLPVRMLRELAHLPGGKATIRRGGRGKIFFDTRKIDDDIDRWKQITRKA